MTAMSDVRFAIEALQQLEGRAQTTNKSFNENQDTNPVVHVKQPSLSAVQPATNSSNSSAFIQQLARSLLDKLFLNILNVLETHRLSLHGHQLLEQQIDRPPGQPLGITLARVYYQSCSSAEADERRDDDGHAVTSNTALTPPADAPSTKVGAVSPVGSIYIDSIQRDSVAHRGGRLAVGDKILSINGRLLAGNITTREAGDCLRQAHGTIYLVIARPVKSKSTTVAADDADSAATAGRKKHRHNHKSRTVEGGADVIRERHRRRRRHHHRREEDHSSSAPLGKSPGYPSKPPSEAPLPTNVLSATDLHQLTGNSPEFIPDVNAKLPEWDLPKVTRIIAPLPSVSQQKALTLDERDVANEEPLSSSIKLVPLIGNNSRRRISDVIIEEVAEPVTTDSGGILVETGGEAEMVLNTEWTEVDIIELENEGRGLGFGIVGGRSTGVVVKTILHQGAAKKDGRLTIGDHIIQINDVHLTGMTSEQVATILRQCPHHVRLVVARAHDENRPAVEGYNPQLGGCWVIRTGLLSDPVALEDALVVPEDGKASGTPITPSTPSRANSQHTTPSTTPGRQQHRGSAHGNDGVVAHQRDHRLSTDSSGAAQHRSSSESHRTTPAGGVSKLLQQQQQSSSASLTVSITSSSPPLAHPLQHKITLSPHTSPLKVTGQQQSTDRPILQKLTSVVEAQEEHFGVHQPQEEEEPDETTHLLSADGVDDSAPPPPVTSNNVVIDTRRLSAGSADADFATEFDVDLDKTDTTSGGLGITIAGYVGTDELPGIFIKHVSKNSPASASGLVRINDQIVGVNDQSLEGLTNHQAVELLRYTPYHVRLRLRRYAAGSRVLIQSPVFAPTSEIVKITKTTSGSKQSAGSKNAMVADEDESESLITGNIVDRNRKTSQSDGAAGLVRHSTDQIINGDQQQHANLVAELVRRASDALTTQQLPKARQEEIERAVSRWKSLLSSEYDIHAACITKYRERGGLGVSLEGTVDVNVEGEEVRPHHYLRTIVENGPVGIARQFKSGDELLEANGQRLQGADHRQVLKVLRGLPLEFVLVCSRRRTSKTASRTPSLVRRKKQRLHSDAVAEAELIPFTAKNAVDQVSLSEYWHRNSPPKRSKAASVDYLHRIVKAKSDSSLASPVLSHSAWRRLDAVYYNDVNKADQTQQPRRRMLMKCRSLEPLSGLAIWNPEPTEVKLIKGDRGLGFSILDYQDPMSPLDTVIVVRSLVPGGATDFDGRIAPGDRLLYVNDRNLDGASLEQAVEVLKCAPRGIVRIGVAKPLPLGGGEPDSFSRNFQMKIEEIAHPVQLSSESSHVNGHHQQHHHHRVNDDHVVPPTTVNVVAHQQENSVPYLQHRLEEAHSIVPTQKSPPAPKMSSATTAITQQQTAQHMADIDRHHHQQNAFDNSPQPSALPHTIDDDGDHQAFIDSLTAHSSRYVPTNKSTSPSPAQLPYGVPTPYHHHMSSLLTRLPHQAAPSSSSSSPPQSTRMSTFRSPVPTTTTTSAYHRSRLQQQTEQLLNTSVFENNNNNRTSAINSSSFSSSFAMYSNNNAESAIDALALPQSLHKTMTLNKGTLPLGLQLKPSARTAANGSTIIAIDPDSAAAVDGRLRPGDLILAINNESLRRVLSSQARAIVRRASFLFNEIDIAYISRADALAYARRMQKEVSPELFAPSPSPTRAANNLSPSPATHVPDDAIVPVVADEDEKLEAAAVTKETLVMVEVTTVIPDVSEQQQQLAEKKSDRKPSLLSSSTTTTSSSSASTSSSSSSLSRPEMAEKAVGTDDDLLMFATEGTTPAFNLAPEAATSVAVEVSSAVVSPERQRDVLLRVSRVAEVVVGSDQTRITVREAKEAADQSKQDVELAANTSFSAEAAMRMKQARRASIERHWGKPHRVSIEREESHSLGISIVGGRVEMFNLASSSTSNFSAAAAENIVLPENEAAVAETSLSGVFVKSVVAGSSADQCGELKVGDRIIEVNGVDVSAASHERAVQVIKNAQSPVVFLIQSLVCDSVDSHGGRRVSASFGDDEYRRSSVLSANKFDPSSLTPGDEVVRGTIMRDPTYGGLGISLAGNRDRRVLSTFVVDVEPNGPVGRDGTLRVGDELIEVNGIDLRGRSHLNVSAVIKKIDQARLDIVAVRRANDGGMSEMAAVASPKLGFPFGGVGSGSTPTSTTQTPTSSSLVPAAAIVGADSGKVRSVSMIPVVATTHEESPEIAPPAAPEPAVEPSTDEETPDQSEVLVSATEKLAETFRSSNRYNDIRVAIIQKGTDSFGFGVSEGGGDGSNVFIRTIAENGPAASATGGEVRVDDQILAVNIESIADLPYDQALKRLCAVSGLVTLVVAASDEESRSVGAPPALAQQTPEPTIEKQIAESQKTPEREHPVMLPPAHAVETADDGMADESALTRINEAVEEIFSSITEETSDKPDAAEASVPTELKRSPSPPPKPAHTTERRPSAGMSAGSSAAAGGGPQPALVAGGRTGAAQYAAQRSQDEQPAAIDIANMPPGQQLPTTDIIRDQSKALGLGITNVPLCEFPVQIKEVYPNSVAARTEKFRPGDHIMEVNGQTMRHVTHETAVHALNTAVSPVRLKLYRPQQPLHDDERYFHTLDVELVKKPNKGLGIIVSPYASQPGIFISSILKDGLVDVDGRLRRGDQILAINDMDTHLVADHMTALSYLKTCTGRVRIRVKRPRLHANDPASRGGNERSLAHLLKRPAQELLARAGTLGQHVASSDAAGASGRSRTMTASSSKEMEHDTSAATTTAAKNDEDIQPDMLHSSSADAGGGSQQLPRSSSAPPGRKTHAQQMRDERREAQQQKQAHAAAADEKKVESAADAQQVPTSSAGGSSNHPPSPPPPYSESKLVTLERGPAGLGFSIVGGRGTEHGDLPIYIKTIFPGGAAHRNGQLKRGDQILAVNGESLEGATHDQAVDILKFAKGKLVLSVLSNAA